MIRRHRRIQITVMLAPAGFRAYTQAVRILARIMGAEAPDVAALIQAQLSGRDPTGVADDYLDSIGWPLAKGRVISLRRSRPKPSRAVPLPPEPRPPRGSNPSLSAIFLL